MLINKELLEEIKQWRKLIHSQPELGFNELKTSAFIIQKLESFGIDVHKGLGGTGVVGTLKNGEGPTIGLRADIDALPIEEKIISSINPPMPTVCMPVVMMGTLRSCSGWRNT